MLKFNRTFILKVGKEGGKGIEIKPPFHIDFDIKKNNKEEPNIHNVKVYNLSPETINKLSEPDLFCVLYAGYEGEDSAVLLAAGNITETYLKRDKTGTIFNIEFVDGWVAIRDTAVSLSYGSGASAKEIIKDIAKQMGLSLMMNDKIKDRTWQHGFSFYGVAHQALHKIVRGAGLEWSIQDNKLQVIEECGATTRQAVVFNSGSGLIGSPERIRIASKEKRASKKGNRQKLNGWRITSLLTPTVKPKDKIKLECKDIDGVFVVDSVKHTGSFMGNQWQTVLEVRENAE
ncbi:phage protein [Phocoenobacter skyensis]|uniref:Phage protein D n=1 Tax=Phocoenobacter skyensis TaxID=97481 RepID=A0ABT9JIY1_9PAST|nr:hypothetical protein [Pasteurella skyensis]MDP8078326.1 hypothetical protein [Pasteurella skyensis]MDP8084582.1 hypothetical protein [Pasteurella skyensis]